MAKVKTAQNNQSVLGFIGHVENEQRKTDSLVLLEIFKEVSGKEPMMWGNSMIGFGSYHYKYKSGREGEWFLTGFSPRKQNLTIYIMGGFSHHEESLKHLGKYKKSKGCLYINKLADIDMAILKGIISKSIKVIQEAHP